MIGIINFCKITHVSMLKSLLKYLVLWLTVNTAVKHFHKAKIIINRTADWNTRLPEFVSVILESRLKFFGVLLMVKAFCILLGMYCCTTFWIIASFLFWWNGLYSGMHMYCQSIAAVTLPNCLFMLWQSGFQGMSYLSYVLHTTFRGNDVNYTLNIMLSGLPLTL